MANLDSRIVISGKVPNVDHKYGPYVGTRESVHNTLVLYQNNVEGLTVGIKATDNSPIKEYWYVGGIQLENLVPKQPDAPEQVQSDWNESDTSEPAYIKNKPTIGDGVNTALPIVGNVKVTASTASGDSAGVTVTPGQNTGEIEMHFTLPKGADGADGQDGQDGAPGADAVNPFKGYYPSGVSLPASGAVGDYLYAPPSDSQSTATATIWHYDSTQTPSPWTDTKIDVSAVVGVEFDSGQSVSATKIKNENGVEVQGTADVLSAEAGMNLNEKIDGFNEEINSNRYVELLVDEDNKILESREQNGKKTIYTDVKFQGRVEGVGSVDFIEKENPKFVDAVVDKENKVIEGTTFEGEKVFLGGIVMKDGTKIKASPLYGKKWAVVGDSFTDGTIYNGTIDENGPYKGGRCVYPYIVANRTGIQVVRFFKSGQTLAWPASPGTFTNSVCNPNADYYYQNIPADIDYITIYLGINDSNHRPGGGGGPDGEDYTGEIPIGTIDDSTTATYYGAWNVVLSWLVANRPFAHIGIIVTNGCATDDYRVAQINIARRYGVPFIDLNGDDRTPCMMRSTNEAILSTIREQRYASQRIPNNTHPNDAAHLYESMFIENFLKSL